MLRIWLEHGEPIIFGQDGEWGVQVDAHGARIVAVDDVGRHNLHVHDAHAPNPSAAFALSRISQGPYGPTPLGVFRDTEYHSTRVKIGPDDLLVLYTDGIPEAQGPSGELYGYDTLLELVDRLDTDHRSAAEIKQIIVDDSRSFRCGSGQTDDMSVVVVSGTNT